MVMYNLPLVPDAFTVPKVLETDRMRLKPLTISDVVKDYEAVMESEDRLIASFVPDGDWPHGLTLEQNTIDLGWHQKEFQMRTSFAYTVVDLDETQVLGCVYIDPTRKLDYDAEITMWVRQSQAGTGLDEHLFETVEHWIAEVWPLDRPGYPGRTISIKDWRALEPV
ncbi:MAG: GNAT family N-acetyltransferase [Rhodospirillales bacterium]|nr:GNAT family N-acetyltransferase [Rhodospirillales bacterium]MBT4040470.1 GNAT family N-acetyltransferase [Rhodospirillales bacterium]MBT4627035.1 GNAT family N-acetyltransferase [Rhodospirillales bacterium]MBT5350760.1 GNAT family N-acetyltransferase [Rhodospirillales bacterium]MBT5521399.1 GNAT family N-acetyltransferase [Rhodospirillales bacterium]